MVRWTWVCLAVGAFLSVAGPAPAAGADLSQVQQDLIRSRLLKDCGTSDTTKQAVIKLERFRGLPSLTLLWGALRHGPTTAERDALVRSSRLTFARMRQFVTEGGLDSVGNDNVRSTAAGMDEPTFVSFDLQGLEVSYRERSLNALVAFRPRPRGFRDSLRVILREPTLPPEVRHRIQEVLDSL